MKVLTEADLRREKITEGRAEYCVEAGTFVTPLAKEYLRDRNVVLTMETNADEEEVSAGKQDVFMTRKPVKTDAGERYADAKTGIEYRTKPEDMTHIRGRLLVKKTDPRIALRGKIDSLQAQVLLLQAECKGQEMFCEDLDSVREYLSAILGAEVKEMPLDNIRLFGLESEDIRKMSHDVRKYFGIDHQIPRVSMGIPALKLNLLRTEVREAELYAAQAFSKGDVLHIVQYLNRLSSGIYILFCRMISGYYQDREGENHE